MFTITNGGRAGADQVGEMLLAFDRINNTSNVDTNAEAWGNGQTITDINTAFGGSWANNTSINANSLTLIDQSATSVYPDGTAFYLTSAGGDVNSSSLNGATYYTYYQGFTGDAFYTLYTDALFTTEALLTVSWTGGYAGGPGSNFAPFETSWGGTLTQTVSGGVTDKKWIYKLPEQSDNLELFEDEWSSGSGATPHTTFTAGGNVTISGNVTYNGITLPTADGTNGQVIQTNGSGALSFTAAGSGTVTSIDVAGGSGLTSSGGPITTSGTITVDVGAGTGITVNADDIAVDEGHTFNFTSAISAANLSLQQFQETVVNMGNQGGDISTVAEFNAANASIFTFTATSDFTISSIPNAQVGSSYTIKVTQDGTGDKVLTSTFKFAGGDKTMSTAADTIDVISVVYDGTDYLASLTKGYA